MRLSFGRNERHTSELDAEKVMRYGDLLLHGPDGEPRVAIVDAISVRQDDKVTTTSRMSFYLEDGEYRLDQSHENSPHPTTRWYMRPSPPDASAAETTATTWDVGIVLMKWRRFSPEPNHDVRPFLSLLERCFGKLSD